MGASNKWSVALAKKNLSKLIEQAQLGPQIITNHGKIVAMVLRPDGFSLALNKQTGASLLARLADLKARFGKGEELKLMPRVKEKLVNPFEEK